MSAIRRALISACKRYIGLRIIAVIANAFAVVIMSASKASSTSKSVELTIFRFKVKLISGNSSLSSHCIEEYCNERKENL
jgi:hypothetical protein